MSEVIRFPVPQAALPTRQLFADGEYINDLVPGGDDLVHRVTFADDEWNLDGHRSWRDKAGSDVIINFTLISARWRPAAKELALLELNPSLATQRAAEVPMAAAWPSIQEPLAPVSAQSNNKALRHALAVIDQHGITQFDSADWDRLIVLLVQPASPVKKQTGAQLAATTGKQRAQQLVALWQVCQISGRETLLGPRPPFDGRGAQELFTKKSKRNLVRPHEGVGHALGYTAWFFDHIADDIVSHIEWWATNVSTEPPVSKRDRREAMLDLCTRLAEQNNGVLPASRSQTGVISLAAAPLGRLLGIFDDGQVRDAARWTKSQLGDTVEYSLAVSPCPLPITLLRTLDGELVPWTDRLMWSKYSLDTWQRRLVYNAMYYLSATLMLRDSQLAVLPFDPLKVEQLTRPDESTYTRRTLSAFKTKNRHVATPTTVVVNAQIAKIIALLHRLHATLGYEPRRSALTGEPFLFDQLLATPFGNRSHSQAREGLYLEKDVLKHLRGGARQLHERGVIARNLDDVQVNMRQVRITCAQAYAVEEHGQALTAAVGQWDTAANQRGYVGDIFRIITPLEPEEMGALVQKDTGQRINQLFRDRDTLTGKGTSRLDQVFEAEAGIIANAQPLTPARAKELGKKHSNISQGPLSVCVFQQEGALCGGEGKADFRLCHPGQCRNSVMTLANRALYELMRRQYLASGRPRSLSAAKDMDERNPDIAKEFASTDDAALLRINSDHVDEYIREALEDLA